MGPRVLGGDSCLRMSVQIPGNESALFGRTGNATGAWPAGQAQRGPLGVPGGDSPRVRDQALSVAVVLAGPASMTDQLGTTPQLPQVECLSNGARRANGFLGLRVMGMTGPWPRRKQPLSRL